MMNGKGEVGFRRKNVGLDTGEVGCWFCGVVDVFVPSYAAMTGDPYEIYSERDGGQGGKEGV